MPNPPTDLEQLIHEVLSQCGWDADAARVAARLSRLNQGLPREDEFSVLCGWLGKCDLIHKLDQKQTPKASAQIYQVPDLFSVFRVGERHIPVLIEVKSSRDNVLSFRPDYTKRLRAYADLLELPLLVAWKHYGIWTAFDLCHMKKANRNFNIDFLTAMTENLLGDLAGDFSYSVAMGAGLHLRFRKEELLKTGKSDDGITEEWKTVCDDVHFTDGRLQTVRDLPTEVQALFSTWDLQRTEEHSPTHITLRYVADNKHETAVFAHMALVRLLDWNIPEGDRIDWRGLLSESKILYGLEDFRKAIAEGLRLGFIHHVLHQVPRTPAAFITTT